MHTSKHKKYGPYKEQYKLSEIISEKIQAPDLLNKDFKTAVLHMLKSPRKKQRKNLIMSGNNI